MSLRPPAGARAQIGPNAVLQLIPVLRDGGVDPAPFFAAAGVDDWLADPPTAMIDQAGVARLHQAVRAMLPSARACALLAAAGRRTGDYILANRIPRAVRAVLRILPSWAASRLLTAAIGRHAWTFAGTARFAALGGAPPLFTLTGNPICAGETAAAPVCVWHAAVFERLFRVLVSPRARVRETLCEASGGVCCRFSVRW